MSWRTDLDNVAMCDPGVGGTYQHRRVRSSPQRARRQCWLRCVVLTAQKSDELESDPRGPGITGRGAGGPASATHHGLRTGSTVRLTCDSPAWQQSDRAWLNALFKNWR
jgi:hypothetical protein